MTGEQFIQRLIDWILGLLNPVSAPPRPTVRLDRTTTGATPVDKLSVAVPPSTDPLVVKSTVYASIDGAAETAIDVSGGPGEVDAQDADTYSVAASYTNKYGRESPRSAPQTGRVGDLIPAPVSPSGVTIGFIGTAPDPAAPTVPPTSPPAATT